MEHILNNIHRISLLMHTKYYWSYCIVQRNKPIRLKHTSRSYSENKLAVISTSVIHHYIIASQPKTLVYALAIAA